MRNPKHAVCCGAIVLYGNHRHLVIDAWAGHRLIVPLTAQRVPRHRADVMMPDHQNAHGEIVRCGEVLSVPDWLVTETGARISKCCMQSVISAVVTEFSARQVELLRPGAYRCALARGYRPGDKGRKIGGAPHAE